MENKIDVSLLEVLEMKEKNLEDYKKSGFENYAEYLKSEIKKLGFPINYVIKEPTQNYK